MTLGEVTTVDDVRAELDASPAAWSLALSVLVGGAAVLVAMLVMMVATATTWRARATDLAALRMAGLPDRSLRRLELLGQLPVVLVGCAGRSRLRVVAAVLALPGVRQFTDPPDGRHHRLLDAVGRWCSVRGRWSRCCCSPRWPWPRRAGPRAAPR